MRLQQEAPETSLIGLVFASIIVMPLPWLISFVLKRAIARHLEQMAQEA